jgi:hypothetical protein
MGPDPLDVCHHGILCSQAVCAAAAGFHQPGMEQTGRVPVTPPTDSIRYEMPVPPPRKKLQATPAPVAPVPGAGAIRQ